MRQEKLLSGTASCLGTLDHHLVFSGALVGILVCFPHRTLPSYRFRNGPQPSARAWLKPARANIILRSKMMAERRRASGKVRNRGAVSAERFPIVLHVLVFGRSALGPWLRGTCAPRTAHVALQTSRSSLTDCGHAAALLARHALNTFRFTWMNQGMRRGMPRGMPIRSKIRGPSRFEEFLAALGSDTLFALRPRLVSLAA